MLCCELQGGGCDSDAEFSSDYGVLKDGVHGVLLLAFSF